MLDTNRLSSNPLLIQSGWTAAHKKDIETCYTEAGHSLPQVSLKELFQTARDIIESLDGILIKNLHPKLGLGSSCHAIEFDFFNYDNSVLPEILSISSKIGKRVVFIGIGYDIIGDWLVEEDGAIYFRDVIRNRLSLFSKSIYDFLEQDIYNLTDVNNEYIFR